MSIDLGIHRSDSPGIVSTEGPGNAKPSNTLAKDARADASIRPNNGQARQVGQQSTRMPTHRIVLLVSKILEALQLLAEPS